MAQIRAWPSGLAIGPATIPQRPLPANALIAADLSDWQYLPPRGHIAVDPVRGRIAFPPKQLPKKVRVTYYYAFSAEHRRRRL